MIKLEVHYCGTWENLVNGRQFLWQGHSVTTEFASAAQAVDLISSRDGLAIAELEDEPVRPAIGPVNQDVLRLLEILYPHCEHGLSADLCMGPNHYPTAEQEREMGW